MKPARHGEGQGNERSLLKCIGSHEHTSCLACATGSDHPTPFFLAVASSSRAVCPNRARQERERVEDPCPIVTKLSRVHFCEGSSPLPAARNGVMVSTRTRGGAGARIAFRKVKKAGKARGPKRAAPKEKVVVEAPPADAEPEGTAPEISEATESEDTIVVDEADQVGDGGEVSSRAELTYEDLRQERVLKNKAMISGLGLARLRGEMATPTRSTPRRGAKRKQQPSQEPSRKSGRSRKKPELLGDFVDEEALELEMLQRRAALFKAKRDKADAAKRFTRLTAERQDHAKRVYKKVNKPVKKEKELECTPLSKDKLEWARQEMIHAFATEFRLDEASVAAVTSEQKAAMVSGSTALLTKVAEQMDAYVLPSMYKDLELGKAGSYKSPSAYFGQPPGVPVGTLWLSRVECSKDGVHGPWVGGIAGSGKTGAHSIVLSGGYEGDTDEGTMFTYTGSGGRDLTGNKRTAPQSSDQELKKGNLALAVNCLRNRPLRVVRGYKLAKRSDFAPQQGYRYDGLYRVVEVWPEQGPSGFVIWRYKMEREEGQAELPWTAEGWREKEEEVLAQLEQENGSNPLIPVGTGTLGLNKEFKEFMKHQV